MNRDTPLTFKEKLSHFELLTISRKTLQRANYVKHNFAHKPHNEHPIGVTPTLYHFKIRENLPYADQ
jgi:hypothetical protein